MITPRATRLHRVPTLRGFRETLLTLVPVRDATAARETVVLVPTRSAAALVRRALEERPPGGAGDGVALPHLVTRRDWYVELHRRSGAATPMLTPYARDVLLDAAAHEAVTEGHVPPFHLRPALVGEMRRFYDTIRRRRQSVDDFERLVVPGLEATADSDRGAERLLRQTRFLVSTFRGYERRVTASGAWDEHALRAWLLEHGLRRRYRQAIVGVADRTWDPDGLWDADFDLLTRLRDLDRLDVVATERHLALGLLERFHDLLPDVEEVPHGEPALPSAGPVLIVPPGERQYFQSRDREEELADRARLVRALARRDREPVRLDRIAVVFQRPLPYLYLARSVFGAAGIPVEARDALPLAAEPFAAALDLVFSLVSTGFSRAGIVQLLVAPQFRFRSADGQDVGATDAAALDRALADHDHLGDVERLERLAAEWRTDESPPSRERTWDTGAAARAGAAAAAAGRALEPLFAQARASEQLDALRVFLENHLRPVPQDELFDREVRAREAVRSILDGLGAAHARYGSRLWDPDELATTVRRWIESETFTPHRSQAGVQLLDSAAARFADLDDLHLVGLVEGEWPRRPRRNIFYSPTLLANLGWPVEVAHTESARAAFLDLLESPARHTSVSTFSLEDDVLVEPSSLLVDMDRVSMAALPFATPATLVFADEALTTRPVVATPATADDPWVGLRSARPSASLPGFHGAAGPQPDRPRSVTSVELYVQCPFKYFARHVLRLDEEYGEEEGLTPLERGRFLHQAFETLFRAWQARGGGTIAPETLDTVRALAREVLEPHLARLPPTDAAFERTRLFGSPVAPGLVDLVVRMEAEREEPVIERQVEHRLDGVYRFAGRDGVREVAIRGIADRLDLLGDGTFRIIDYKSSKPVRPLQLAIYASCARQRLAGHRGRDWQVSEAAYLTFRGDPPVTSLGRRGADLDQAIADAEARFVDALDGIARGAFPPRPARKSMCGACGYAAVCRRDYVDDEDASTAV